MCFIVQAHDAAPRAACGIVSLPDVTSRDVCPCVHALDAASKARDCIVDAPDTASWAQRGRVCVLLVANSVAAEVWF